MKRKNIRKSFYNLIFGTYRSVAYFIYNAMTTRMPKASQTEIIDVVIPAIEKDLDILPLCIEGIKRNVSNKIGDIYIVAPLTEKITNFAKSSNITIIDEKSVLGYGKDAIGYRNGNTDKSGWILQQLLKLSANIGKHRYYLVIDADHILLNKHTFLTAELKTVFYMSKEYYYPYYLFQEKVFGKYPYQHLSYVDHKMLFDKEEVKKLHSLLEQKLATRWDEAIVSMLKSNEKLSFSEFETYGHMFPKERKIRLSWHQKELTKLSNTSYDYESLHKEFAGKYLSLTFPDYKKL